MKRGDLALASGTSADRTYDVHMATVGGNLACQTCHICGQCHSPRKPSSYDRMHSRHVDNVKADCSWCHTFSRPERGLTMP